MAVEYTEQDIMDLFGSIFASGVEFKEILIKVNKPISTAEFNKVKEYILRFTKSYKVNNRKYKDNDTIIIYYKFNLNTPMEIQITAIHQNNTLVMFLRDIKIKSLNKGE